jgi:hypothetical protein
MAGMVKVLWGLMIALELAVLLFMAGKRQYRDFPAIFMYLLINLIQAPIVYAVYVFKGFGSWPAYWTAWISQALIVIARWLAVCELCRNVLGQFQGIWALTWRVLALLGSLALLVALALGGHDFVRLVTTFDLGLELSMTTVLVGFFLFARYYRVVVQNSLRSIGIAFCLYSIFRAFNDSVLQTFLRNYANTWNVVDEVTYIATLTLLGSAVYVFGSEDVRKVVLLPRTAYAELTPQLNEKLKALDERLNQLLNSKGAGKL